MATAVTDKNRIEYIDLAKGICIIMVVLFHVAKYYEINFLINSFFKLIRMPLYFFLSGVFFKSYSGLFDFIKRKTNKLLIPFVFWYLLISVGISLLLYHFCNITLDRAEDFTFWGALTAFWTREDFPNSAIWFLLCLFYVNLLFYLVYLFASKLKSKKIQAITIFLLSMAIGGVGLMFWKLNITLPGFVDSAFSSLPFFCFGYLVKNHTKIIEKNRYDKYLLLISIALLVCVGLIALLFGEGYSLKFNHFTTKSAIIAYPCGFLGTLGVILFSKKINRIPVISMYGRYSIMILVTHKFLAELYAMLFSFLGMSDAIAVYVNLGVTLLSYLLLIPLMKEYMPHVTAQKDVIPVGDRKTV